MGSGHNFFGSRFIAFTVSLFATLFPVVPSAYAQDAPDTPPWVEIKELQWAGSGCPPGSASVAVTVGQNRDVLWLAFLSLIASTGPDVPITEMRKNCSVLLRLSYPSGWSFTLIDAKYRGFASLDYLVEGIQRSAYFFEGDFPSAALQVTLVGPFNGNYETGDTLDLGEAVWSPCGEERALIVNTEIRADNSWNPAGRGLMTTDTIDGQSQQIYGIKWRRCG